MKPDFVFSGAHEGLWTWFWAGLVAVAAVLILMLLQQERRLVSRKAGLAMLVLRLGVLAMLLLTLMQPVITWSRDTEITGSVLVALDVSESMSTADRQASPAEKLRWARALGMYGNAGTNDRIDAWLAAMEAGQEPEWVQPNESADPTRRAELTAARKQNLNGVFDELGRLSRREIALQLLTKTQSPLLEQLSEVAATQVSVFAGEAQAADEKVLQAFVDDPPLAVGIGLSDISKAMGQSDTRLKGIVLLTDGRHTSTNDPVSLAAQLGNTGIPVYPIILGSAFRPRDLSIGNLEYSQTVFKDDNATLTADILASGFDGEKVSVTLKRDGEILSEKTVVANGTSVVEFPLNATEEGRQKFEISVAPQDGETREDNNTVAFAMNVVDDHARVLLLDGESRWEFRFLHRALDRDERVETTSVVFNQPYIGQLNSPYFAQSINLPADVESLDDTPLADIDVVIVGDVSPQDLNEGLLTMLDRYVSELGGTVIFQAGKSYMPLAYDSETLAKMLPIMNASEVNRRGLAETGSPRERGVHVFLTADALDEAMFQFVGERFENRRFWSRLPGHSWAVVAQAKPAASVFACVFDPDRNTGPEFERNNALIAHHYYGFGQVMWMGIDSTWRWRFRAGDKYHHRFWGQLARWAASNKAAAGNASVRLKLSGTELNQGDDLRITALWSRKRIGQNPGTRATIVVTSLDEDGERKPFSELQLEPEEGRTRAHSGRLAALPAGSYRAEVRIPGEENDPIFADFFVHEEKSLELSDVSCNRALLQQIAEASGGRVFNADEASEIPELLRGEADTETRKTTTPLWNHWGVMLVFFGLMTLEWIVRKLSGLP